MQVGDRLKAARLAAGCTNASAFARDIGVQPNTIYRLERDAWLPPADVLKRWAERCGVSADSLLGVGEEAAA